MYLLGYDIGSSSVKAALVNAETGKIVASDFLPKTEMPMLAKQAVGPNKIRRCGGAT